MAQVCTYCVCVGGGGDTRICSILVKSHVIGYTYKYVTTTVLKIQGHGGGGGGVEWLGVCLLVCFVFACVCLCCPVGEHQYRQDGGGGGGGGGSTSAGRIVRVHVINYYDSQVFYILLLLNLCYIPKETLVIILLVSMSLVHSHAESKKNSFCSVIVNKKPCMCIHVSDVYFCCMLPDFYVNCILLNAHNIYMFPRDASPVILLNTHAVCIM